MAFRRHQLAKIAAEHGYDSDYYQEAEWEAAQEEREANYEPPERDDDE